MRSQIISLVAWLLIFVTNFSRQGEAIINIKPSDAVVLLNGSTYFNCSTFNISTNLEVISWYHKVGSQPRKEVYEDGGIFSNYIGRFRVEKDLSKGVVNLIVEAPTLGDAGTYQCVDEEGVGKPAEAQLTVLETEPICNSNLNRDGVIGPNDCGIPPDQVHMSCSITYRGSSPVNLEWRNGLENDNSMLTSECGHTTNSTTCNLTVDGDRIRNNSVYICQTKNTGKNTYSCSTDAIRILYSMNDSKTISTTIQEEFICSANSSQKCSYIWESDDGTIISRNESLTPKRIGHFLCQANCKLRGDDCLVIAGNLNISFKNEIDAGATTTADSGKPGWIVAVVVGVIIISAVIIIAIVWSRRKKNRDPKIENEGNGPESHPLQDRVGTNDKEIAISNGPVEFDIKKACDDVPYIGKGLSGLIHGPVQYSGRQCAFERIMISEEQFTPVDGEQPIETKICMKGNEWKGFDHDNLIKFYDIVKQAQAVYVVMEYAAGRSVRKILNSHRIDLPVVKAWAMQIAQGMNYLYGKGIAHRGLKCARILIMEPFDPSTLAQVTLKISSYSLTYDEINSTNPATFKGMFAWMAPEAISDGKHTIYSDIWSYGVTVWEIFTGAIPHKDKRDGQIIKGIPSGNMHLQLPDSCHPVLCDIFKECFDRDPTARPTFEKILTSLRELDA